MLTSLYLPALNLEDASEVADIFWRARLLYRDERVIDTLLLYALLGVSYRLFDESGYPPHFLLFLYGKTGSFKTALAKVLFTQLCDERYRKYPRRIDVDTPTSLEIALTKSGCDTLTLIGLGGSPIMAMWMGAGDKREAQKILNNSFLCCW